MSKSIAIIGAGVSGLTSAVVLAEEGYRVVIFAEVTGRRTTSGAAAAIWFPYDVEPANLILGWALETYRALLCLEGVEGSGVTLLEVRVCTRAAQLEMPAWAGPLGGRSLESDEIPPIFQSGFTLDVPLTDTTIYLDYLSARFSAAGGEMIGGVNFQELSEVASDFGLVINCAGVGAKILVPDPDVTAHRGQIVVVPRVTHRYAIVCDDEPLMYAIPRGNDCVLGGTNEVTEDCEPDPAASARIVAECGRILGLSDLEVLEERVGLRPYRAKGVRLERENLPDGRPVIHNYGHGGSGFTLSWGCAREVARLVRQIR